jgi:hypothetical protein
MRASNSFIIKLNHNKIFIIFGFILLIALLINFIKQRSEINDLRSSIIIQKSIIKQLESNIDEVDILYNETEQRLEELESRIIHIENIY